MIGGETVIAELHGMSDRLARFRRSTGSGATAPGRATGRASRGRRSTGMIPNLMTMLGLCAGLTSMRFGLEGRFGAAAVAIVVGGRDRRAGRPAGAAAKGDIPVRRRIRQPVGLPVLRRRTAVRALPLVAAARRAPIGYAPCLMFAVCMALRLARFNASLDGAPRPAYAYNFFTGVPAPAGAGLALFPAVPRPGGAVAGLGLAAGARRGFRCSAPLS